MAFVVLISEWTEEENADAGSSSISSLLSPQRLAGSNPRPGPGRRRRRLDPTAALCDSNILAATDGVLPASRTHDIVLSSTPRPRLFP